MLFTMNRVLRNVFERRATRRFLCLLLVVFASIFLFVRYLCPEWLCNPPRPRPLSLSIQSIYHHHGDDKQVPDNTITPNDDSPDNEDVERYRLDGERDTLVFLHIQKTGGSTFGRHLVRDALGVPSSCDCRTTRRKRCNCTDSQGRYWLFSRYSTGWACGLHADWTELHECVPSALDEREQQHRLRRYHRISIFIDGYYLYDVINCLLFIGGCI